MPDQPKIGFFYFRSAPGVARYSLIVSRMPKMAHPPAWALQKFYLASIWPISPYVTPTDPSPVPADKNWLFELDRGMFQLDSSLDPVYRQALERSSLLLAEDFQHFAISEKSMVERWGKLNNIYFEWVVGGIGSNTYGIPRPPASANLIEFDDAVDADGQQGRTSPAKMRIVTAESSGPGTQLKLQSSSHSNEKSSHSHDNPPSTSTALETSDAAGPTKNLARRRGESLRQQSLSAFVPKKMTMSQKAKSDGAYLKLFTADFQPFSKLKMRDYLCSKALL
ncbi:hypothetical protein J6590_076214 [Homalodisca vitripennis]|nr:hypothetical protein J6590_076214 [Homalodisca vitripennis]